jgi:tetratricopeptide (TPR) repeat protein
MNASQIESTYKAAHGLLLKARLKPAMDKIRLLIEELQWGEMTDKLNELEQNYRFMLQYFASGAQDPERKIIYNKLIARLINLNNRIKEELLMRNATSFEYTQIRYFPHKLHFNSTGDLYDSLLYFHNQSQLIDESDDNHGIEKKRIRSNFERLLPDLFMIYWLTNKFQPIDKQVFKNMLDEGFIGKTEKNLLVAALTLNLWRNFDEEKLLMLFDACQNTDMHVRQRSLVGLCFILTRYNQLLPFFPSIRNRLIVLADDTQIFENLKNIIILIIGTNDTDKITRKMQEEILPEMMKISPAIRDKMENQNPLNTDEWDEENPEWQEILQQSGIADKLQELTELQLEGADVYMSTFSLLKSFPFFNETSSWFLPFDPEMLAINELFRDNDKSLLTAFLSNSVICNSDKYSFCLSILQMPENQRQMIGRTFKAEAGQLEEISKDETMLKPDVAARNTARQYIQDLFRFFRLHPQHADFQDMFNFSLQIHETGFFDILAADNDLKNHVAEYYFTKGHYTQAITLFSGLIKTSEPTASLYQKLGFAYQKNGQFEQALDAYLKADMILPDDIWTVRKIAQSYKLTDNFAKALEYYQHLEFLLPGKSNPKMQIAGCLTALNRYKEALDIYLELENNDPENEKIWKAVAECAFLSGNLYQAEYYLEKLINLTPDANDYLLAGHIALCLKKIPEAIRHYKSGLTLQNNNFDLLLDLILSESEQLFKNGVDKDDLALMLDEIHFSSEII